MLNSTQKDKIKRFLADKTMSNSVKEVLRESFLKSQGNTDVYTLAAERLAVILLDQGFKELSKFANQTEKEEIVKTQVGL